MKAQNQNLNSPDDSQNQNPEQPDSRSADMISGLNQASTPEQARGLFTNSGPGQQSTTGTKPEGSAATSPAAPRAAQSGSAKSAAGGGATWEGRARHEGGASSAEDESSWLSGDWQNKVQDTLKTSWQSVSNGVRSLNVSPTALAIGAAVGVGAAVWFGRKQWIAASEAKTSEAKTVRSKAANPTLSQGSPSASDSYGASTGRPQPAGKQSKHSRSK